MEHGSAMRLSTVFRADYSDVRMLEPVFQNEIEPSVLFDLWPQKADRFLEVEEQSIPDSFPFGRFPLPTLLDHTNLDPKWWICWTPK